MLASEATGGVLAVLDCDIPAATAGPPLHIHPRSDETFIVKSGTLLVHLDGDGPDGPRRGIRLATGRPAATAHRRPAHQPGVITVHGLHHVKVPVSDLTRSRAWYETVLSLSPYLEFPDDNGTVCGVA